MSESLDPGALSCFADAGVRYVVVGGLAVNAYGVIRATKDVDICPDPSQENLARLACVLRELQAVQMGIEDFERREMPFDPTNVDDLSQGGNFRLVTRLGNLDARWQPSRPPSRRLRIVKQGRARGSRRLAALPSWRPDVAVLTTVDRVESPKRPFWRESLAPYEGPRLGRSLLARIARAL